MAGLYSGGNKRFVIVLSIAFFLHCITGKAQNEHDFGIQLGSSSHFTDINIRTPFYSPGAAFGAHYRYNINPREVVRISANYMRLSGADADFSDAYQLNRNASFSTSLFDVDFQFELNFLPFKFAPRKIGFSPFVSGGLGFLLPLGGSAKAQPFVPFAVGLKWNYKQRWTFGAEWNHRKLFTDNLEGIEEKGGTKLFMNNDWYSYCGIFVSYKLLYTGSCPQLKTKKY
jgi:hypothetical protein